MKNCNECANPSRQECNECNEGYVELPPVAVVGKNQKPRTVKRDLKNRQTMAIKAIIGLFFLLIGSAVTQAQDTCAFWVTADEDGVKAYHRDKDYELVLVEAGVLWSDGTIIFGRLTEDGGFLSYQFCDEPDGSGLPLSGLNGEEQFLRRKDVSRDPRDTRRWEDVVFGRVESTACDLWSQVELGAGTVDYPEITLVIIQDMVKSRVLDEDWREKEYILDEVREILIQYSMLVWN